MFIKNVKWKENVYAFLIKNTFICWNMLKTKKQLPSNFSERTAWCLKITQFFSQSKHTEAWPPSPTSPVRFSSLFKELNPPPCTMDVLFEWPQFWVPGKVFAVFWSGESFMSNNKEDGSAVSLWIIWY